MNNQPTSPGQSVFERIARVLVWIGGIALILMAFVITYEALIRKFLNKSLGGVDEITSYVFAITATLGFAFAIFSRANIRIDVLRNTLGAKGRVFLDILALACFILVFTVISYRAVELAINSYTSGARSITPLQTLLYIPQSLWAFGLVFTTAAAVSVGVKSIRLYRRGEAQEAANLLAPTDEVGREVEEVLQHSSEVEK